MLLNAGGALVEQSRTPDQRVALLGQVGSITPQHLCLGRLALLDPGQNVIEEFSPGQLGRVCRRLAQGGEVVVDAHALASISSRSCSIARNARTRRAPAFFPVC